MATSAKLRRLLAGIKNTGVRFCSKTSNRYAKNKRMLFKNEHRPQAQYGSSHRKIVKLQHLPTNQHNRVAKRLQDRRFVTSTGTLRQMLGNSGIYQAPRLLAKCEELELRVQQAANTLTTQEFYQFNQDFKTWYKTGQLETRDNYFWRIKYCGLIELGVDWHYWMPLKHLHQMRKDRHLKSALDYKN
jgi:TfoX/Sxy family transcriptional regulator of competence genes